VGGADGHWRKLAGGAARAVDQRPRDRGRVPVGGAGGQGLDPLESGGPLAGGARDAVLALGPGLVPAGLAALAGWGPATVGALGRVGEVTALAHLAVEEAASEHAVAF
jgi:hypothetical protein